MWRILMKGTGADICSREFRSVSQINTLRRARMALSWSSGKLSHGRYSESCQQQFLC